MKDLEMGAMVGGLEDIVGMKGKKRYPGQTRPLPSDEALESNKERQDREARDVAKRIMKGIIAPGASVAEEAMRRMPRDSYAQGGKVSSASKRADGCAIKGKTRGRMV
jgi:hypothetical protein